MGRRTFETSSKGDEPFVEASASWEASAASSAQISSTLL